MNPNLSAEDIKNAQSIKKNAQDVLDLLVRESIDEAAIMTSATIVIATLALMVNNGEDPTEFLTNMMEKTEELYAYMVKNRRMESGE